MFGIGETELVLIVLFAFMIFGPDKLPGMGRTIGRALRQFRSAQEGFTEVVQTNIMDPAAEALSDDAPKKKASRDRATELDEDADLDLPEGEEAPRPKRAETFAERKKRLAEEKKAREAAEAEAEKNAAVADDSDADVAEDAPAQPTPAPADDPHPKKPTAADLYAMRPSSRETGAGSVGENPVASREASEERSDERRADGALPDGVGADAANDETKEA
ncbi:Sec-independent protein translocase subunit TatA/TatB [Thermophilibacter sp.]|uniref:Sec-independent protein translocase subunit TatA/TatB n=1 Tax=Thermophilibacter sp. TaxID=2847309 RepID=UPI003A8E473D